MSSYVPPGDGPIADELELFAIKVLKYQILFGLSDAEVESADADAKLFRWAFNVQNQIQAYSPSITGFKNLLRYGNGSEVLTLVPVPPVFTIPPGLVDANVQLRFTKMADKCKANLKYTYDIGKEMGIEGTNTPFVPGDGTPVLKGKTASGGHPLLHYTKSKYEGAQIWKDWGDGKGFVFLTISNHPDFLDLSALPAAGISAIWKYKAVYLYQGAVVGNFSGVIEIAVVGI
jgi:hypothetical protein